jgi:PBP1b-binding outer membrane lipoprotein LpoB
MPGMGKTVAELVLTHHERLDGFGYPRGLMGEALPLDHQMLALSELLGSMKSTRMSPLMRADVAVKLIPGEYERELIDVVDQTVRQCEVGELVQTLVPLPSVDETLRKAEATASYVQRLAEARELLMVEVQSSSEVFKQLTKQAFGRFDSIQKALASTGVDTRAPQDLREHLDNQGLHMELALVLREINWRLRELEREMTARVERAAPTELERLARVVAHIRGTQDGTAQPATADALG